MQTLRIFYRIRGYGSALAKDNEDALQNFANLAVRTLANRCPEAILDGLVRVDVF